MEIKSKLIALGIFVALIAGAILITGQSIETPLEDYNTYTKALCDKDNYCQDHVIACKNKEVISIEPITGAAVQFSKDWQDTREDKTEIICK